MKANIEVKSREEGNALKAGLNDPVLRAMVTTVGVLMSLPTDRARRRVLEYVADRLDEEAAQTEGQNPNNGGPSAG